MAKPKTENTRRVSGVHPASSTGGKIAFSKMKYAKITDGVVHPDYDQIAADIQEYLDRPGTLHNPAGYRQALNNMSSNLLNYYNSGYVCYDDTINEDIEPNEKLIEVMTAGRNALINKLYNQDSKYQSQLVIRTLEGMGELTPQKKVVDVNLSGLGTWEKWSK